MNKVIIVGAGAAGLAAAVTLKKGEPEISVVVLEKGTKAGKKILVSGNGRCNLSNINAAPKYYNAPAFLEDFFKIYDYKYIEKYYRDLGLMICRRDDEGRAYPVSNSAVSVMDVYNAAIKKYGVDIRFNACVTDIIKSPNGYIVKTADGKEYGCSHVIYAVGSPAGMTQQMGTGAFVVNDDVITTNAPVPICCLRPSLCPLPCNKDELEYLENIRVKCKVSGLGHEESGEVQFRKDSLSGIVIFNFAARLARRRLENTVLSLDLFPEITTEELYDFISAQKQNAQTAAGTLAGLCVNGIAKNILSRLDIAFQSPAVNLTRKQAKEIAYILKNYEFKVYTSHDFKEAQAVSGGVALSEVDNITFASKRHKGLYVVGEALDIDGECGGYNLHFATCSGIAAAIYILK